ncbi:uncharacterized protein SCHCODRAFT_02711520 [Schizophyllum commune H4-8]|uniref:uncharacterized protein n=1 Tax=Schizophyllum commune (strain H4-8 / FGSC 9210) TaxID=578458 RepID=UPI00215FAFCE|nr:uncharacterized protein SCHCODRAFT_02711520 [Schizophyllum commune H4-8]KAI5900872.1 hypothetical protein SCHCODRAFT_02711520 [Schizophyllum commune H4-8]
MPRTCTGERKSGLQDIDGVEGSTVLLTSSPVWPRYAIDPTPRPQTSIFGTTRQRPHMHKSTLSRLEAPSSRLASAARAISSRGRKVSIILPAFQLVGLILVVGRSGE